MTVYWWNEESEKLAVELRLAGKSYTQIARAIGAPTRQAVASRLYRLGFRRNSNAEPTKRVRKSRLSTVKPINFVHERAAKLEIDYIELRIAGASADQAERALGLTGAKSKKLDGYYRASIVADLGDYSCPNFRADPNEVARKADAHVSAVRAAGGYPVIAKVGGRMVIRPALAGWDAAA
jgi:hypothetical protein